MHHCCWWRFLWWSIYVQRKRLFLKTTPITLLSVKAQCKYRSGVEENLLVNQDQRYQQAVVVAEDKRRILNTNFNSVNFWVMIPPTKRLLRRRYQLMVLLRPLAMVRLLILLTILPSKRYAWVHQKQIGWVPQECHQDIKSIVTEWRRRTTTITSTCTAWTATI